LIEKFGSVSFWNLLSWNKCVSFKEYEDDKELDEASIYYSENELIKEYTENDQVN